MIFSKAFKPEPLLPDKYVNFLAEHDYFDPVKEAAQFSFILDNANDETAVQKYIKDNNKWFIPYSVLNGYPFYHYGGAYLFKEQPLGAEYRTDYCLLSDNSDGYHLLLVEFETPNTTFLLKNKNTESDAVRKGLTQIRDWRMWLTDYRPYFLKSLGISDKGIDVPLSRINYCLVVSRRELMDERARKIRNDLMYEQSNLRIITYDRLVDNIATLGKTKP